MDYRLEILVEGDHSTFLVTIPRTEVVDKLKQLIYEKGGYHGFRPHDLKLLKVEIDIRTSQDPLSELRSDDHQGVALRSASQAMSELWEEQPPEMQIHIFVKLPVEVEEPAVLVPSFADMHLMSVFEARDASAPSSVAASVGKYKFEQSKRPIYNGRPVHRRGPPVVVYNESLAQLKHDLSDLSNVAEPHANFVGAAAKFFNTATPIYDSERDRGDTIFSHLNRLLGADLDLSVQVPDIKSQRKSAEGDAAVQEPIKDETFGKKKAVVAYIELKNELGQHGDSGLQAALSLRKHIAQKAYDEIRNASCSPCIIISVAGPYLQISGAVFVEVFAVQNFTDYIYLGGDPFEEKKINYVAKIFYAVAQAVRTLREHYHFLHLRDQREPHTLLPNPTYLPNSPPVGSLIFKKSNHVNPDGKRPGDYRRTFFFAEYEEKPVLVKFCEKYCEDAHRILAAAGLAPRLHFCSPIIGDIFMVVMHLVHGRDAYSEFRHRDLPSTVLNDVKLALEKLHGAGLVFGDMRRPNIMVYRSQKKGEEEWRGMLVDFDWAGPIGKAKYPAMLNTSGQINWAEGVVPAALIKQEHDLDMLEKLNLGAN